MSCWTELSEGQQDELLQSIEQALAAADIPEVTQTLLNLAEFMEHCDKVEILRSCTANSFIDFNIIAPIAWAVVIECQILHRLSCGNFVVQWLGVS